MSETGDQNVITTETARGRWTAAALRGLHALSLGSVTFILLHGGLLGGRVPPATAALVALAVVAGAAMVVMPGLARWTERRGAWEIADDEIVFVPRNTAGRCRLGWSAIERVTESGHAIRLHGPSRVMVVGSCVLGRDAWWRLRDAVRAKLADRLDPADAPPAPRWLRTVHDSPRMTAIAHASIGAVLLMLVAAVNEETGALWPAIPVAVGWAVRWLMPLFRKR